MSSSLSASHRADSLHAGMPRALAEKALSCWTRRGSCCLALFALLVADCTPAMAAERPNIVLIVADDLGYGDLGCYGQTLIQTPQLDQLAARGLRFTQFYAGSTVCAPSRCVLMTGLHTGHCSIRGNGRENLRPEDITLAEVLQQAGYLTGICGKWGLGHEGSTGVPTLQGFDFFFGYVDQHHAHNYYPSFLHLNEHRLPLTNVVPGAGDFGDGVASQKLQYSHDLIIEQALEFVRRAGQRPFFLYLPLTIPHANNEAGKQGMEVPELGEYADRDWPEPQRAHAAMITRMDRDIGRMIALLNANSLEQRTLILFTSDNGPHREGGFDPSFANSNGPLRGIKRSLHDGGIRVPLIAAWSGQIRAGRTTDWVGGFQDLLPTLAELAGAASAMPAGLDGISLVSTLTEQGTQVDHDYLYWAFYEQGGGEAIRRGDWKAVRQPQHSPLRLYQLNHDAGEHHNLAAEFPQVVRELESLMRVAYHHSPRWQFPVPPNGAGSQR
jgi:uncharacterized sulfatase